MTREGIDAVALRLPRRATTFVGRRKELQALRRLLNHTRLLTLVGPGGAGKTRLAAELARAVAPRLRDGVLFVDLTTVGEDALVVDAIVNALDVTSSDPDRRRALVDHLRERSALIVLDNCEHLLAACAAIASDLHRECSSLTLLATSRERLNIEGETVWPVPPLSLPHDESIAAADSSDAVRLFIDRARLVQPEFSLGDRNVADIVAVCRVVDGIPLGVELAAARLGTATPREITGLLADHLGTLVGGTRDIARRQQTLRATIAWSHDLLNDDQRALLRRMATFAGGQRVDAISDVCAFAPLTPDAIRNLLTQLVEKSMLWARGDGEVTRFGMLQPMREFAIEQLQHAGEMHAIAVRHHALYARLVAEAFEARRYHGGRVEHDRLWSEMDDVRAALAESPDAASFMEMATGLVYLWLHHAPAEGYRHLREAFTRLPDPPPVLLARAGRALLVCSGQIGDYSMVNVMAPRTAAAVEEAGLVAERGHQALQRAFHAERLARDPARARDELRAALAAFEADSPGPDYVLALASLGSIERQLGNLDTARRVIGDALERAVQIDDLYLIISAFFHRGWLELDEGGTTAAQASFVAGLELADESDRLSMAHQVEGVACALAAADPPRAARLFGAAARLREVAQAGLQQPWQSRLERGIAEVRDALGVPAWERERTAGRALSPAAILDVARGGLPSRRRAGGLSGREVEVARLVAAGMTNRAIAAKLFLSERTVESHLDHILTKLQFTSRSQLAAWVTAQQL